LNLLRKIALALTLAALAGGLAVAGASTSAAAATTPVVYASVSGWSGPSVRPAWIYIGQGGSPMAHTWHWSTWNGTYAWSGGTLWVETCVPNCALGHFHYYALSVTLWRPAWHSGVLYYSRMTWRYYHHWHRRIVLRMTSRGYWTYPAGTTL
jgi:hypothetical protein